MKALSMVAAGLLVVACSANDGEDVGSEGEDVTSGASFAAAPTYVDFTNASGRFRIYTTCLGPDATKPQYLGHEGTVGPGYVATMWDAKGRVITDDTAVLSYVGPNSGATGIGQFGFHLARVPQDGTPFTAGNADDRRAFQVSGRFCNANRRPSDYGGYNGFGVRSSKVTDAPHVDMRGIVRFAMDVVLGDDRADLVDVRYTYEIAGHDAKMWIRVTNLCDHGKCGAGGDAFVKEPKVIAGVNPRSPDDVGYELMTTFGAGGFVGESTLANNHWKGACGESPNYPAPDTRCEYGGQNPVGKTGQCDDPARAKVRFWSGKTACAEDPACLVVSARAADTEGGATVPWSGSGKGLDAWAAANVAENRDRAATEDSPAGGAKTACGGNAAARVNRRWEMAGFAKTAGCSYTTAIVAFHGWEGGTGIFDCENLYYRLGPAGESYVMALAFGAGSVKAP